MTMDLWTQPPLDDDQDAPAIGVDPGSADGGHTALGGPRTDDDPDAGGVGPPTPTTALGDPPAHGDGDTATDGYDPDGGKAGALLERFVVPPFSVLDTRQGYWRERRNAWLSLGIRSEVGRDKGMVGNLRTMENMQGALQGRTPAKSHAGVLHTADSGQDWEEVPEYEGGDCWAGAGTSIFDPVLCELIVRWFTPPGGTVLDPFAGGSVRGIVAARLGRQYVGVELRDVQVAANVEQGAELADHNPPLWVQGDARDIRRLAPATYDGIFTCPPYFDLEVYSDDPDDLSAMTWQDFRAAYMHIVAESVAMLAPDSFSTWVVSNVRDSAGNYRDLVGLTIKAHDIAGASYYNEGVLVNSAGTLPLRVSRQFQAGRKLGRMHQSVLTFVKGDGKAAARRCGEVECGNGSFGDPRQRDLFDT